MLYPNMQAFSDARGQHSAQPVGSVGRRARGRYFPAGEDYQAAMVMQNHGGENPFPVI